MAVAAVSHKSILPLESSFAIQSWKMFVQRSGSCFVWPLSRIAPSTITRLFVTKSESTPSFVTRNQFLIYRLFSLSGLVPVGAFLVVHLLTNASVLGGPGAFQSRVDLIHSLGPLLVPIEWAFIFLPMLFHATVGFAIIAGGLPNVGSYPYAGNVRYTLQRATAMIVFAFIIWHLIQLHWMGAPLGGGRFDPHRASSSAAVVLQPAIVGILYAIGIVSAVFHLSNGLWTLGITWGLWTSPAAMRRASWVSIVVGVLLGGVGLGALSGMRNVNVEGARVIEDRMEAVKRMLEGQPAAGSPAAGVRASPEPISNPSLPASTTGVSTTGI